ncbi:nuclear pore complex protein Nup160 homolog [Neodiprion fabricii]|uniref:nuclear pore complex protein Nup160 homolog n=1 Tax=Neodiprion fabricii TaxID=2872261 RepID=UPI001ED8E88D|nr:nuclear pore complex protein Nup160 homolog [Neodiprion fabricii]
MEFPLGYREVIPDQTLPEKWKEIVINAGGSQSTLQDIKVPERAGGYSYKDSTKHFTRNRFIYWRISHDVLELVEHSLDVNLANCKVRYKFTDRPLLDGISIHETVNSVVILVVTVSSVHKLTFPHPDKIHRQEHVLGSHPDLSVPSILNDASKNIVNANTGTTNTSVPHAAASWLTLPQEEALFALAYSTGNILLIRLDTMTGLTHTTELKQDSIVPRFLSGIATAFRGRNSEGHVPMSLVLHSYGHEMYLFALCREGNVRMWACSKAQCVAVADIAMDSRVPLQGVQGHILKKTVGVNDNELYLGTFLKFGTGCEFSILKPLQDAGLFKFVRICTLFAPDQHLVDFSFTPTRLWAVWRTTDMDTVAVTHARLPLNGAQVNSEWETAVLVQPPDRDYIVSDPGTDPRQAYIGYIFHPGQFPLADITRALSIYRRSNIITDTSLSPAVLKERVCMAVEAQIQAEVMDYELSDDDYLEIANRCWSKFYSCVIQYYANGTKPVGLLLLPNVYGAVLLKKSAFSLLRPMEALEHLMLCNDKSYVQRFSTTPVLSQDEDTCQNLITLMSALVLLDNQLTEDLKSGIERELYHLRSPDIIIEDLLCKQVLETEDPLSDYDFQSELNRKIENINDISQAMAMLVEALTYDLGQPSKLQLDEVQEASRILLNVSHLFSSQLGMSAITESVSQITQLRFSICRNLLILQQLVLKRPEAFDPRSLHSINSSLAPRTVVLTQAYYAVMWICESTASSSPTQTLLDTSIQHLSLLKLSDSGVNIVQRQQRSLSLLELFMHSGGAKHAHTLMAHTITDTCGLVPWHESMLTHVTLMAQFVWPISGNFIFPEWLLSSCQHLLVQEYVRMLSTWCEWNSASRKFIMAVSLLEMGETHKACDQFLGACNGILTDTFLASTLLDACIVSESSMRVNYFLKVIQLFEHHNAADCIIELAETAITIAEDDNPNLPTLHSIVFRQHLNLEHHTEAYHWLNSNPDPSRKVDCLRQLVATLFERNKLLELVTFPYVEMYEDLERIIEGRARSMDLMENNYYNFLYSFHINKGNMRKAASVMYEQGMRLGQESHSPAIILKQSRCLLACINALHLVKERYRWIVRPVADQRQSGETDPVKKRSIDGREVLHYKVKKQVEVLELKEIKDEYYIVTARLKLAKLSPELQTIAHAGPSELVAILSNVGLYTTALHLCDRFSLSKTSVLENLASQCVTLSYQEDIDAWDWLIHNEIFDKGVSDSNVTNIAWRLLEHLTLKHERDNSSELHKAVTKNLLHHGAFLPQWLMSSYKERNAAEILRLILNSGRLLEANAIALEYIGAVLGRGKEYFGLTTPLVATSPAVWLPLNTLELLLLELEHASKTDPMYIESYEELKETLDYYIETVIRVSEDMIQMKTNSRVV